MTAMVERYLYQVVQDIVVAEEPKEEVGMFMSYTIKSSEGRVWIVTNFFSPEFRETCQQIADERGVTLEKVVRELNIGQFNGDYSGFDPLPENGS